MFAIAIPAWLIYILIGGGAGTGAYVIGNELLDSGFKASDLLGNGISNSKQVSADQAKGESPKPVPTPAPPSGKDGKAEGDSKPSNKPYKNNKEANKQAQKQGYKDAHELKEDYVGKGNVSKYDMKYDTKTGKMYLESKDGKIQIPTGLIHEP